MISTWICKYALSMKDKITKYSLLLLFIGLGVLFSCTDEVLPDNENPIGQADNYLQLHVNLPTLKSVGMKSASTRAMNDEAEREITLEGLSVLVFKEEGTEEKYVYKAPLSGNVQYDQEDPSKAIITVKLVRSEAGEKYRLVVIANHTITPGALVESDTKAVILERLTYDISDKWNADNTGYTPFPMWGESDLVEVKAGMLAQSVDMYRALSRIDVGLDFAANGAALSETANGLDEFKLKQVNVYRTYNSGFVAPTSSVIGDAPFIPSAAQRRADDAPLQYVIVTDEGADSYVREIYIPEADLPSSPSNDNMHCLVIGGFYKGSTTMTYYRLDFATETNQGGARTYLPVRRNHRYVFNITQVRGPGFDTPEAALKSTPSIGDIGYEMIEWDETIHDMEVQGKYYFGLDQRNILFNPEAGEDIKIKYQTNLPSTENFTFDWKSGTSSVFGASHSLGNKEITVTTLEDNITNAVIVDTLYVKSGPFKIPVHVEQRYVNFKYTIDCGTVKVEGTYINGTTLGPSHMIKLRVKLEDETLFGKPYVIETDMVNGIWFKATGNFGTSSLIQDITLTGHGTLASDVAAGPFSLRINSSSSSGSYCEATIHAVPSILTIVVLGNQNSDYGYAISRLNRGAGKVFNHPNNFGPNDNSIIKVAGFEYITSSSYVTPIDSDTRKWITGTGNNGKIADMVYISYPAHFITNPAADATLLKEYMEKGGVVVAFLDYHYATDFSAELTKAVTGVTTIGVVNGGDAGTLHKFPAYGLEGDEKEAILREFEGDPIMNGPFGDVRDKLWGEDASYTRALTNVPRNQPALTIYSTTSASHVTMYKYESDNYNMVFVGDGGFMSSGTDGNPLAGLTICPFYWNTTTFFPIAKPSYGSPSQPVYNSIAFCNIMAWAVQKSQSLKAKRANIPSP